MKRIGDVMRSIPIEPPKPGANNEVRITRTEAAKCPICQDAGYLRANVPVGHPMFGRIFPCECKKRQLDELHAEKMSKISNLESFTGQTFEEFDPDVDGVREAFDIAWTFAQEPKHRWLFLYGPCGTGKTHLAVAIAKHVVDVHQMQVYFAVVPDLLDHLRATFDPNSGTAYDERFNLIRTAQLLVLDDLGTENATPWAREKLYQIINHRYVEQMPTVITSNVDQRKVDERILSRILDHHLTDYVEVNADDYRRPGDTSRLRRPRRF